MQKKFIFLVIFSFLFHACNSSPSKEVLTIADEKTTENNTTNIQNYMQLPSTHNKDRTYFVNQTGDDPYYTFRVYRSITDCLKHIAMDTNLSLDPFSYKNVTMIIQEGVYSEEDTNETFPLVFPAGMLVKGEGSVIIKQKHKLPTDVLNLILEVFTADYFPLFIVNNDTIVDSITIEPSNGIGILAENNTSSLLKNVSFINGLVGLKTTDNAKVTLINTNFNNNELGIEASSNSKVVFKGISITENKIGIKTLQQSQLMFTDKNTITDNTFCGLYDKGNGSELVLSNQVFYEINWSYGNPKIYDYCQNGVSVASDGYRNILFQKIPDDLVLFSNVPTIKLFYPQHESYITTNKPYISWQPTPDNIVTKVIIFNSFPIVNNNQIINKEDVVWYWDSTSNPKLLGHVKYSDGKSKGALIKGKGYYYVVLEMNKEQTKVTAASNVYYFTVSGDF